MKIKSSVDYYSTATVEIGFPNGEICCKYCPLLETYARNQCRRTGEYISNTNYMGGHCPLKINWETVKEN